MTFMLFASAPRRLGYSEHPKSLHIAERRGLGGQCRYPGQAYRQILKREDFLHAVIPRAFGKWV